MVDVGFAVRRDLDSLQFSCVNLAWITNFQEDMISDPILFFPSFKDDRCHISILDTIRIIERVATAFSNTDINLWSEGCNVHSLRIRKIIDENRYLNIVKNVIN